LDDKRYKKIQKKIKLKQIEISNIFLLRSTKMIAKVNIIIEEITDKKKKEKKKIIIYQLTNKDWIFFQHQQ
jgi:hypothetical protein